MTHVDDIEFLNQFRDDGDENGRLMAPVLAFRLALAYRRSSLMRDECKIESAGRTREEQDYLYKGWKEKRPGFNLAANPERIIGAHNGTTFIGSWHMEQPDGHTYAVALTVHGREWQPFHEVLDACGLYRTVRGEPWHHQASNIRGVLPGPLPDTIQQQEDVLTPELDERLDGLATWFLNGVTMILKKIEEVQAQIEDLEAKK